MVFDSPALLFFELVEKIKAQVRSNNIMAKLADLHVHTCLSDGTFSPEKVIGYAKAKGLAAVAITDHDCCGGIAPAIMAGEDFDVEVIPGVELSAEMEDQDVHILGYFIDWQNRQFLNKLEQIVNVRRERAKEILNKLRELNVGISEEELFELSSPGCVGRLHIAQLLLRKGYVSSISHAFEKYIGDKSSCYVKKFRLSPKEAVDIIKDIRGIPVLAHPKTIELEGKSTADIIKLLVQDGIMGIEVYHSDHTRDEETELNTLAEEYNLLMTGGSDCHGFGKREVLIGKVRVPYELVEKMKITGHLK